MNRIIKSAIIGVSFSVFAANTFAAHHQPSHLLSYKGEAIAPCVLDPSHWYVAGNLGVSHLYDKPAPASGDSVDENGPGWDAAFGYQYNKMFGGELGYTQYYNSRETIHGAVLAKTTHFAVHLNATGRYPIYERLDVLGKLGIAYAYAQKVFAAGTANSSGSVSPYLGLGLSYALTPRVNAVGQWAFVRGNSYTGSNTLYSLGFEFAIV